jgi:FlaG/FlaF family flagellin (archaellin)
VIARLWQRDQRIPQVLVTFTAAIEQWLERSSQTAQALPEARLRVLAGTDGGSAPWIDRLCAAVNAAENA